MEPPRQSDLIDHNCFLCVQVEGSEPYWEPAIVFCVTRSKGLNRIGNLLVFSV